MKKQKPVILRTSSKELYNKFTQLKFYDSIFLEKTSKQQLGKIIKNILKNGGNIDVEEKPNNIFIIRKTGTFNFDIYLK